ncbi:MAG TPA: hypothetical protein VG649_21455 [Candidatus Angelobacter sp.]|jgi:plasmid stability protein|nr:hypothetical protein [Candidatus Angelobacter sp.]
MNKKAQHRWTERDDLVAVYIYKHGAANLGMSVEEIAQKLGMSTASMKMRVQNVKSADVGAGLNHIAEQTRSVLSHFDGWSEAKLRAKIKTHLATATRRSDRRSRIETSTLTIRQIDKNTVALIKARALRHGRSIEEEAREILRSTLGTGPRPKGNLADRIRRRVAEFGGVELELPPREPVSEPPDFDE